MGEDAPSDLLAEAVELADALERELAALEAALSQLEAGDYGRCDVCGRPIEEEILDADATAARCTAHAAP